MRYVLAALLLLTSSVVLRAGEDRGTTGKPASEARAVEAQPWVAPRPVRASRSARRAGLPTGTRLPAILLRIRECESHSDYRAENPRSTASGAWQVVDGTWDGYGGYRHASHAPRWVQDAQAVALYLDRGTQPWKASRRCWA